MKETSCMQVRRHSWKYSERNLNFLKVIVLSKEVKPLAPEPGVFPFYITFLIIIRKVASPHIQIALQSHEY